jgi:hypothetical protein
VPEQPLRAIDAIAKLLLRLGIEPAKASHGSSQMFEAHADVRPIQHPLGAGGHLAGAVVVALTWLDCGLILPDWPY